MNNDNNSETPDPNETISSQTKNDKPSNENSPTTNANKDRSFQDLDAIKSTAIVDLPAQQSIDSGKLMKYTIASFIFGAAGLFFGFISFADTNPNSTRILVTLPLCMFSIILAFLIFIWSNKPLFYKNLQLKGFILEDTLATLVMKIDVGNLLSRRKIMQKSFTIAFFADGDKLKIAEIYNNRNSIVASYELPMSSISMIYIEKLMDTNSCFIQVDGLSDRLSVALKNQLADAHILSKVNSDKFKVSSILSRNEFDTDGAIILLQKLSHKYSIPISDKR
jgi:hypothetical protein